MMVHIKAACIHRLLFHRPQVSYKMGDSFFIGRKFLTKWEREYNNVHGYYHARIEHLFACLWHWKVIRDIWMGSARDHANTRILLHSTQL